MRPTARVAVFVFLATLVAGCGRNETPSSPPVPVSSGLRKAVLQTDWFPQAEQGGYYQALAKGFYAEAGLDLDIWPGGPGAGIKLKVARGEAQFGMLRSDDVMIAASAGLPLMMVAATMQHDPQALMVHTESPVKTFQDLDGRAVIGFLGMAWFPYLEKKYGITITRRQNTYGLGEFLANPDVIQQCVVTNEPFFARQHGREVRTLLLSASGYDCYQVIVTRRDLIRNSPDVVRGFVQASIRGWRDYLEQDPAPANDVIMKRNPQMTRALLEFSRAEMIRHAFVRGDPAKGEDIGQLSLARIKEQMDTLLALKIMTAPLVVASVASAEFSNVENAENKTVRQR